MIWWYVGAVLGGLLGLNQYKSIKVGDRVIANNVTAGDKDVSLFIPGVTLGGNFKAEINVRAIEGNRVLGSLIDSAVTKVDTQIPVSTTISDVVDNLTPRLF